MRKTIYIFILLAISSSLHSQTSSQNYIVHQTMRTTSGASGAYYETVDYFDGIGKPVQQILNASTTAPTSMVKLTEYDNYNRILREWLPTPYGTDASYKTPAAIKTQAQGSSGYSDTRPYNENTYQNSPVDRLLQIQGPGSRWNGHPLKATYQPNTASECKLYTVSSAGTLAQSSYYPAGTLEVVVTTDEDGKRSYTYTNKEGNVVLERKEALYTYYVYDDYQRLRFVLQPQYQTTANTDLYAFQYTYDYRGRLATKKIPGSQVINFWYDKRDNLAISQDGNDRTAARYTFYLYDKYNRLVLTGKCTTAQTTTVANLVAGANFSPTAGSGIASTGYTASSNFYGGTISEVSAYYYDNYNFRSLTGFTGVAQFPAATVSAAGYLTATIAPLLGATGNIYSAIYYDTKGRVTKEVASNHLAGYDTTENTYTFTSLPSVVKKIHTASGKTTRTQTYTYSYDGFDRPTQLQHQVAGSTAVTILANTYNNLGQLSKKTRHNGVYAETYNYNVRGWITAINGTRFKQNLSYDTYYNGNISSSRWTAGTETTERGYTYTYDNVNRLTGAVYGEGTSLNTNTNRYTETPAYDNNGNITTLKRYGKTSATAYALVDDLTLTYTGNQLKKVTDAVTAAAVDGGMHFTDGANLDTEYTWDANGNMVSDANKRISSISYNAANLPRVVTFQTGATTSYVYDATGNKRKVTWSGGTSADYCGEILYENGNQTKILNGEGFVDISTANPVYYYYLRDHQGNNRVVINSSAAVQQVTHYYPFGATFSDGTNPEYQKFKYNDKELDKNNGLNLYDYGARMYDPVLGRFMAIDPLTEKSYPVSSYVYGVNNPVLYIDPLGLDTISIHNQTGRLQSHLKTDSGEDIIFLVDNNGVRQGNSLTLPQGSILSTKKQTTRYKDNQGKMKNGSIDIYNIRGDANSTALFEFLADHFTDANKNPIEFGHFMTGLKGNEGLNFITTTGLPNTDKGGTSLINGQLRFGYTIRSHSHNHPSDITSPSGRFRSESGIEAGKHGDLGFKNSITNWYIKTYPERIPPIFYIYTPVDKLYINY